MAQSHGLCMLAFFSMVEYYFFSVIIIIKPSCRIYCMTVTESMHNLPIKLMSCHWAPSAFAFNACRQNGPWRVRLYNNEVRLVIFAYEPSLFDAEKGCRI